MTTIRMAKVFTETADFVPAGFRTPCRDVDPDLFFPIGFDPGIEARAVCRGCPVAPDCADWATRTGQEYGIFGGLDPQERKALKRQRVLTP